MDDLRSNPLLDRALAERLEAVAERLDSLAMLPPGENPAAPKPPLRGNALLDEAMDGVESASKKLEGVYPLLPPGVREAEQYGPPPPPEHNPPPPAPPPRRKRYRVLDDDDWRERLADGDFEKSLRGKRRRPRGYGLASDEPFGPPPPPPPPEPPDLREGRDPRNLARALGLPEGWRPDPDLFAPTRRERLAAALPQIPGVAAAGVNELNRAMRDPGAYAAAGHQRGGAAGRAQAAAGHALGALSTGGLGGISQFLQAGGQLAGAMPGGAGAAAEGMLKLSAALTSTVSQLQRWSQGLHDSNVRFAEFSASMTRVQVEQEVRDIRMSARTGEARAESARQLAEAKSRLAEATMPWENKAAETQNAILQWLNEKGASILEKFNEMAAGAGLIDSPGEARIGNWRGAGAGQGGEETFGEMMSRIGREHWSEVYGRPPRFRGE